MSTRDRQHPAAFEDLTRQPLRPGRIGKPTLEQGLDYRVAAGHDVADHHDVGRRIELPRLEALDDVDAEGLELRAHGRIDVAIRAGDPMTGRARYGGNAAHESAADSENMNVHVASAGRPSGKWRWEQSSQHDLAGDNLQDHEKDARRTRPFERGLHDMAVGGNEPGDQHQPDEEHRQLPGGILYEARQQPV